VTQDDLLYRFRPRVFAIAAELATRLGGSIELVSHAGATVFTLKLPTASPARPEPELVADVAK